MKEPKKISLIRKAAVLISIVSMSFFLFTGCQNNTTKKVTADAKNSQTNQTRPNAEEMKKKMQDNLSSLVKDGTINQSQSDKILEALTANTQRFNGERRSQGNGQNGNQDNKNNGQNNAQKDPQNNDQNNSSSNQGNKPNRQRNNALSTLISDGTITQAQADAVMQKIRGNFGQKGK